MRCGEYAGDDRMEKQRLDKIVSGQLNISRTDVKKMVSLGQVVVNGVPARSPADKADPQQDEIMAGGVAISYKKHIYLMLNKPEGVVSATRDGKSKTVLDLVPQSMWRKGLFPAGRLDKDTVGFVLITDDGELAHRMLAPKSHVPKTYHAVLDGGIGANEISALEDGIDIGGGDVCGRARVRVLQEGANPTVEVIISEGMYHQIKRMFAAVGRRVLHLKRVKIGALPLDERLPEGGCKEIINKDVEKLLTREISEKS